MKRIFELLWIKIREYFKHPVEHLRQAQPIVPGRIYNNYGYLCKAVPYNSSDMDLLNSAKEDLPDEMRMELDKWQDVKIKCLLCDLQKKAIPCPYYNKLQDGRQVCDVYKYVIIKNS